MNSLQVESQENFQTATGMSRDIILVTGKPGVGIDLTITACKKTSTQSSSHAVKTTKSFHCSVAGCGKVFTSSNHLKVCLLRGGCLFWQCLDAGGCLEGLVDCGMQACL